ncbi:MAG: hypothetical protein WCJ95_22550 [Mariniphaga sp.]
MVWVTSENDRATATKNRMSRLQNEAEFYNSPNKTTHFIGFGQGGCNTLELFFRKGINAKYTGITEPGNPTLSDGINFIPFTPPRFEAYKHGKETILKSDMNQQLIMPDVVKDLFIENHRYVLLAGLAGYTVTYMVEELTLWLNEIGKVFLTICSLPYFFEGDTRNKVAERSFVKMRSIYNFRYCDFNMLMDQFENDTKLGKAFEIGIEKLFDIYMNYIRNNNGKG